MADCGDCGCVQDCPVMEDYDRLVDVVQRLYYAAYWSADRAIEGVEYESELWVELRDAAGIQPGMTREVLGPPPWEDS